MSERIPVKDIVERMYNVREERRRIAERDKELVAEWRDLENRLLATLDEQGQDMARVPGIGTAAITSRTLPNVVDWDRFYEYLAQEQAFYLLQRRIATAAFKELHDSGIEVPGVEAYTQRNISLRKANG